MSEKSEKRHTISPQPMTSSDVSFCPNNTPKLKDMKLTIIYGKQKQAANPPIWEAGMIEKFCAWKIT